MSGEGGGGILHRIGSAEKRLNAIEPKVDDLPVIRAQVEATRSDLKNLKRAAWAVFLAIFGVGITLLANVVLGAI